MTLDIDWAAAWRERQGRRAHPETPAFWDNRAADYAQAAGTSSYAQQFVERMGLKAGETVLDMGCGPGTLSIPLARSGHHVYACDFSSSMLDELERAASKQGVSDLVHAQLLSWDDDWEGSVPPVCDIAIASRSIATDDLADALAKLDGHARRRVCVTLATGLSPRVDAVLHAAIGRRQSRYPDCVFAFNILWQMGVRPEMSYIDSAHPDVFESFEAAIDKYAQVLDATPAERERLIAYSREHLHETMGDDGVARWEYDHVRVTSWAFLAWNK